MKPIKSFITDPIKAIAFRLAKQAATAKDFAIAKARRQSKRPRSTKVAYVPGTIGLSSVSEAIKKDYGTILSRRDRKALAKEQGVAMTRYYNN